MPSPSTTESDGVAALPTFAALDARAVLEQERHGASIQIDQRYFRGQEMAIDALRSTSSLTKRQNIASRSRNVLNDVNVDFKSIAHETLQSASDRFRTIFQQIPEVQYLKFHFPETCFIIPEWLRTRGEIKYGARIYFFREDDAPAPSEIVQQNIDAIVDGDRSEFERYLGALHGYPECCIEWYADRARTDGSGPELEAVDPITNHINDGMISEEIERSISVADVLDEIFGTPSVYAFFAREFFPEPECTEAHGQGLSIYETLRTAYPATLVNDYFRINAGWSYMMAKGTASTKGGENRPMPGTLGWEHLLFFLPLSVTATTSRYQ